MSSNVNHAESIVYQALKPLEEQDFKIYHSVRFVDALERKHDYEADFLICGLNGFMILEVKGGNIKMNPHTRVVTTTNRLHKSFVINPWDQAMSNSHQVFHHFNDFCMRHFGRKKIFHTFAAVFPDGSIDFKNKESVTGHQEVSWDVNDLAALPNKVIALMTKHSDGSEDEISTDLWDEFYSASYLDHFKWEPARVLGRMRSLNHASNDLRLLESIAPSLAASVPLTRVLIEGGPGTGKTAILTQKALEQACPGEHEILYVCYNQMLAERTDEFFIANHAESTYAWEFHALCEYLLEQCDIKMDVPEDKGLYYNEILPQTTLKHIRSGDIALKVSHIIVDEAQDLVLPVFWEILWELHKDPEEGFWWIGWDPKQCIYNLNLPVDECLANLNDSFPLDLVQWTLTKNLRNHPKINAEISQSQIWELPTGLEHLEDDETKNYQEINIRNLDSKSIAKALRDIREEFDSLGLKNLRILSHHHGVKSIYRNISENDLSVFNLDDIPFCTVQKFKGLDEDGIILLDFDKKERSVVGSKEHRLFYMGISRAKLKVWVVNS